MRKLVEVTEVEGEGLDSLLGEQVLLFGLNYIYSGKLVGVNSVFVKLEDAKIVYDTGPFNQAGYKDAQSLPSKEWYVQLSAVESYGREGKKGNSGL
jgi:hypothetical protein